LSVDFPAMADPSSTSPARAFRLKRHPAPDRPKPNKP
jgi:hypothetical protein